MTKMQFYKFAAVTLLVLNIGLLSFLIINKPGPKPKNLPEKNAMEMLDLDKDQHDQFLKYAESHVLKIKLINNQQEELLTIYFNLPTDSLKTQNDEILKKVNVLESEKIQSTNDHLREIKSLLREDQLEGFIKFKTHLLTQVLKNPNKKGPTPRDF